MVKAWAKAAVAGAALMMGAPVWGAGPKESFDETVRSGHWTFKIGPNTALCDITGYANPNDIYSDQISIFNVLAQKGNQNFFAISLDFTEKTISNLEIGDDADFIVAFANDGEGDKSSNIGFVIGSNIHEDDRRLFILSGPLEPFSLISSAESANVVWIAHGKNWFLEIPLPDDFFEMVDNCMDESWTRISESYGKAQ